MNAGAASVVAQVHDRGMTDYLRRANDHHETAQAMSEAATVRTDEGIVTAWENPQQLRLWAHEQELAQECWRLAQHCAATRSRALHSAYRHLCLVNARAGSRRRVQLSRSLTLAQVAAEHHRTNRRKLCIRNAADNHAPPILATCHASNAPGLTTNSRRTAT